MLSRRSDQSSDNASMKTTQVVAISQVLVLRKTRMNLPNPVNPQPQNQFPRIKRHLKTLSWVRLKAGGERDDIG